MNIPKTSDTFVNDNKENRFLTRMTMTACKNVQKNPQFLRNRIKQLNKYLSTPRAPKITNILPWWKFIA